MVISWYEMTMSSWSVADAKARFSKLVARAAKSPQRITRRGRPVAIVTRPAEDDAGNGPKPPHPMEEFLRRCEALRAEGALDLTLPPRKRDRRRSDPFGRRR